MAAISGHIPSLKRQIKNVACNYSDAQVKVREATSNDPWGASSSLMSEIADLTYNALAFTEIMQIIWKRLNDSGKNWRHVYKSLVLLDYLIKVGSEKVAHQCRENIFAIQTLKDFQHIEDNKDQGMNVREKAKQLVAILKDDERLKNERTKALMARKRFTQNGTGNSGEAGHRRLETCRSALEFEECRPSSVGEEEMQLQIALALSKEEAEKEQEVSKNDDVRFQLALAESQKNPTRSTHRQMAPPPGQSTSSKNTSALDDLLSLHTGPSIAPSSALDDPWGGTGTSQSAPYPKNDFFGPPISSSVASVDPWSSNAAASHQSSFDDPFVPKSQPILSGAASDPWGAPAASSNFSSSNGTSSVGDPWGADILAPAVLDAGPKDLATNGNGTAKRNLATPDNFLGENSNLVNLDNLMAGSIKPAFSGMSAKTIASPNNPFASTASSATIAAPSNPFSTQQKRATPTLNEMRAGGVSAVGGAWTPNKTSQSANNPFM